MQMTKYGSGKKRTKSNKAKPMEITRPNLDESSPYNELCKFADEFRLHVELDKPFEEFQELKLHVVDSEGERVKSVTLDSIESLDKISASMLNELGKQYR